MILPKDNSYSLFIINLNNITLHLHDTSGHFLVGVVVVVSFIILIINPTRRVLTFNTYSCHHHRRRRRFAYTGTGYILFLYLVPILLSKTKGEKKRKIIRKKNQ